MDKQGTKNPNLLVNAFRIATPNFQEGILFVVASELQSASTQKEKSRWAQAALALTPYKEDDAIEIKVQKLDLLRDVAEVSFKKAGVALKRAREYMNDLSIFNVLLVAEAVAQYPQHAGAALALVRDRAEKDPDPNVRLSCLGIAEAVARHPNSAGDALALAWDRAEKDPDPLLRLSCLGIAEAVAQHPNSAGAALALAQERADKDPDGGVRDLARSILEGAKPKPEGTTLAAAAGAPPAL